jgi:hypothetical protein
MEDSFTTNVKSKKVFFALLIFCILILGFTAGYRVIALDGAPIGEESYYNLRLAENTEFLDYDALSFMGRFTVMESFWILILSVSPALLSFLLPFLFGIGTFIFFYLIMGRLKPQIKNLASLLLIISPAFIYLFSTSTKFSGAMFFTSIAFYCFLRKKRWFALAALFLVSMFSSLFGIGIWVALLLYYVFKKKEKFLFIGHSILLIVSFLIYYIRLFDIGWQKPFFLGSSEVSFFLSKVFVNFGAAFGFGVFMFVLALIGIYAVWNERYKFILAYLGLFFFLLFGVYLDAILLILGIVLVPFAAIGLRRLYRYNWKIDAVKYLVIIIIFAGLLFTTISYEKAHVNAFPNEDYNGAIKLLEKEGKGRVVLSDPENGHFISYAGTKNIMDTNLFFSSNAESRYQDIRSFYYTKDADTIYRLVEQYDIRYVLVDASMKRHIWYDDDQGLLSYLRSGDRTFFKAYSSDSVEIWELINV